MRTMKVGKCTAMLADDLDGVIEAAPEAFEKMYGSHVLLTGGAGFLGYYLTLSIHHWNRKYKEKTIKLFIIDNFTKGIPGWINALKHDGNIEIIKHDITKPVQTDNKTFDYILHAASIASPTYYRQAPLETMHANVEGIKNLLSLCVQQERTKNPVKSLLFFSSSEIYGDATPENIPTPEDYNGNVSCTGPRACYDESKRYGETLCVNYYRRLGIPAKIVRPFNNYGPGLNISDRRVIPDFAKSILSGDDLVILSNGSPSRTFCYIADAIAGYFKVLTHGNNGEPYNIGSDGPEVTILELAKTIKQAAENILDYQGNIVKNISDDPDYLIDNPQRRCPDISKARNELGFSPGCDLLTGLQKTLIWYCDNQI